MAFIRNN